MSITSETQELQDIIARHFEMAGERATHADLMHDVVVPDHIAEVLVRKGLSTQITSYFSKKRADGLPFAPIVNEEKEHVNLELAGFEELEYVARGCVARGKAEFAQAQRVSDLALATHGRSIVIDGRDLSRKSA